MPSWLGKSELCPDSSKIPVTDRVFFFIWSAAIPVGLAPVQPALAQPPTGNILHSIQNT
jgi:hypothetical protein